MVNASDLETMRLEGAAARRNRLDFFANPNFVAADPASGPDQLEEWFEKASAWAAGWMAEDAGRDQRIRALMRQRYW